MRFRVVRPCALVLLSLPACVTTLSYTRTDAGAGAEGGTSSGSSGDSSTDTGIPPDGAFAGCPGSAQFCDNFDDVSSWMTGWHLQDRAGASAFSAATETRGAGKALRLKGNSPPGGYVSPRPSEPFQRRGGDAQLVVRFLINFPNKRRLTFLEIANETDPVGVKISLQSGAIHVDGIQALSFNPTASEFIAVAVTLRDQGGTSRVELDVGGSGKSTSVLPTTLSGKVKVFFGVMDTPNNSGFDDASEIIVDDIVIE